MLELKEQEGELMIMQSLEHMLSPMVKIREDITVQNLNKSDIALLEKIQKQKIDVVHQRISPSQVDLIRPEVVASWIRSYNYGLDLFNYNYGPILDKHSFDQLIREKDLLLTAADPYIRQLETMLFNSECKILLSDEQGVMLRIIEGHERLVQEDERFRLFPGTVWTEETVGTCAHGLCLILKTPIQICGPEHYCETFEQITVSSAPIFDTYGNLAGTLTLSSSFLWRQNSHSLGLAASAAWAIQNQFQLALNNELLSATLEASDEAVITINKSGVITKSNVTAKKIFNYLGRDLTGMQIEAVFGHQPQIKSVLETGKPVLDIEIEIEAWNQRLHLHSAQPVQDCYGQNFGCVLTLKKIDRVRRVERQPSGMEARLTFDNIVGSSPQLVKSIGIARKFARLEDANILIEGESGTGKEVYAQAIHNESRPDGPFIAVNCAAIPKTLIESELFGYEGGAFTGAERQGRRGKVELANGGTLFLDEIGDMPLDLQPVLLRVLEEKKLMRVGGTRYLAIDFRLITATNKNLLNLVKNGQFREDLYYRLKVLKIVIPPLRERGPDIIRLAKYFINTIARKQKIPAPSLSDAAIFQLLQYNWPGNVRQLENAMFYAINTSSDGVIRPEDLPEEICGPAVASSRGKDGTEFEFLPENRSAENSLSIKEVEKITVMQAMIQTGYNICEAADILGMSRSTLYRKAKEYNLLNEMRNRNKLPLSLK